MQTHETLQHVQTLLISERQRLGVTVGEHAKQLGVSEPTYYRIQNGQIDKMSRVLVALVLRGAAVAQPAHQ